MVILLLLGAVRALAGLLRVSAMSFSVSKLNSRVSAFVLGLSIRDLEHCPVCLRRSGVDGVVEP